MLTFIICVWYVWMGACSSANVCKHLSDHGGVSLKSFCSFCFACIQTKQNRSHANHMTVPCAKFSSVFSLQKKIPLEPTGYIIKPFQQLSVCFGREKSSWRITLKGMLACDTFSYAQNSTVSWRPLTFIPRHLGDTTSRKVLWLSNLWPLG